MFVVFSMIFSLLVCLFVCSFFESFLRSARMTQSGNHMHGAEDRYWVPDPTEVWVPCGLKATHASELVFVSVDDDREIVVQADEYMAVFFL